MGAVYFYHLTRSSLEDTLRVLLGKSLEAGWRVELRCADQGQADRLDAQLWLGPDEGFLPHGLAGGDHDGLQPVILTMPGQGADGCTAVMSVGGAEVIPEEVAKAERVSILFDGHDEGAVGHARGQWKALTSAGVSAQYWSQESGRWEKKAEA